MASADATQDPLLLLRQSIASGTPCVPTNTADATSSESVDLSLATARYLQFTTPNHVALPLTTPTRWISASKPVDLRSIYYAYLKKDIPPRDYVVAAQALSEELKAAGGAGEVQTLDYVGQLDLVAWLEGASDESEHIKPLASDAASASASAQVASGAIGGIAPVTSGSAGRQNKTLDPRLAEIYNGERRMGDRNSVLRGIKPTDFSHVRKLAHPFNARKAAQAAAAANAAKAPTTLPHNPKAPVRRPDPIVLLSPSASSLLRLSNIKSFLEGGTYIPPESSSFTSSSSADFLQITRVLPTIDQQPMRFIIADSAEKLKPEHWSRVVAVFTTGQVWQFKSYKWQNPPELFRHTLGVYLGWRGDHLPDTVKGWGRGVLCTQVEKYAAGASAASRWRDREVVESIWKAIEDGMRNKGWTRASGPSVM